MEMNAYKALKIADNTATERHYNMTVYNDQAEHAQALDSGKLQFVVNLVKLHLTSLKQENQNNYDHLKRLYMTASNADNLAMFSYMHFKPGLLVEITGLYRTCL